MRSVDIQFHLVNKEFEKGTMKPLKNDKGMIVEKYIPRKCGATSRILGPQDYASVQIFFPDVDEEGRVIKGKGEKVAICGFIRDKGRSDYELEKILKHKGYYPITKPVEEQEEDN